MVPDLIEDGIADHWSAESSSSSIDLGEWGIQEMFCFQFPFVILELKFWFVRHVGDDNMVLLEVLMEVSVLGGLLEVSDLYVKIGPLFETLNFHWQDDVEVKDGTSHFSNVGLRQEAVLECMLVPEENFDVLLLLSWGAHSGHFDQKSETIQNQDKKDPVHIGHKI